MCFFFLVVCLKICPSNHFVWIWVVADRKKDSSLELLVHGLHLTKTDLKKMEKLTKINIHLHGESLCLCDDNEPVD